MARAFNDTLRDVRDGDLLLELAAKMQDLVAAVRATDKPGKMTIVLSLKPLRQGKGDMLMLEDDIKLVLPEPDRESTTYVFATETNELTRRDPRQPELPGVRGLVTMQPKSDNAPDNAVEGGTK